MLKKSLYFFMSVVETGSFSQAAKKHYLSQAAISQHVIRQIKRCLFRQIKTGLSERYTMV